ncbi:zf-HC2 domain-containing protein [Parachitinimonas caeni]|uniref:Zf-HC2 domain-containing protein n=1 Tax=Parachitinimonas caeni TaxID=3031301 RepID=A0ABT7E0W9_9NEIS|nr:zf-HC2 domain-containing protein [Parachitinimonas caeni]MDK2124973.1 zf-HC2 domain-containing protein [Parachitinimonas caeni]
MMLSCKEATRLMSMQMDRELSMGERLQLALHLTACAGCRNFRKQIGFLRTVTRKFGDQIDDSK